MVGRIISLMTLPLMALSVYGLVRQTNKMSPIKIFTPLIGIFMAPLTLVFNILVLKQAYTGWFRAALLLVFGLGFGVAWGQTTRIAVDKGNVIAKRSVIHLVFWGVSCIITQFLATFAHASIVAGGLTTMFFSAGSSLGTNLNLLVRMLSNPPTLEYSEEPLSALSPGMVSCPKCGKPTSAEKQFCTQCGSRLSGNDKKQDNYSQDEPKLTKDG